MLMSNNLDTSVLKINDLEGDNRARRGSHGLAHDRAGAMLCTRSDITLGLWKAWPSGPTVPAFRFPGVRAGDTPQVLDGGLLNISTRV